MLLSQQGRNRRLGWIQEEMAFCHLKGRTTPQGERTQEKKRGVEREKDGDRQQEEGRKRLAGS